MRDDHAEPLRLLSTAKVYSASTELVNRIGTQWPEKRQSIGKHLYSDPFYFHRNTEAVVDASSHINRNLIKSMPDILSSK